MGEKRARKIPAGQMSSRDFSYLLFYQARRIVVLLPDYPTGAEAKQSFAQSSFAYFSFKKSRLAEDGTQILLQGGQDALYILIGHSHKRRAFVGAQGPIGFARRK